MGRYPDEGDQLHGSPFAVIPEWVLLHPDLSPGAVRCYGVIQRHVGRKRVAWPGQPRLAAMLHVSERTVRSWLGELEAVGALTKQRRFSKSNLYTVVADEPTDRQPASEVDADSPEGDFRTDRQPASAQSGSTVPPNESHEPEPRNESHLLPVPAERAVAILSDFDRFWQAYPLHVGKQAARKAWARAVKETDPEELIAGAIRYADDPNRDGAFTAYPATWLNAGRWDDEPLPARSNGARGSVGNEALKAGARWLEHEQAAERNR